ncbi:MAG: retroviral-like aspartic protease family protein [Treponema sp.]|jgi:clan AA aspartic protease|nr:retroviral-like aspartic protease family protein [Treponema sp.]
MGEVKEKITLVNTMDAGYAYGGYIKETEIRQLIVDAVVDTGAMSLVIDEKTCARLGLAIESDSEAVLAGGDRKPGKITKPVTIRWNDRFTTNHALVLPGTEEILLGVIPLEDMDLKVNPVDRCLEGVHGDRWVRYVR